MIHLLLLPLLFLSNRLPPIPALSGGDHSTAPTVHEVLQSYDFPVGLLPKGVTGYDLDESTGRINVYLNGSCSFSLEGSYQLFYKSKISGRISKGKLTKLSGISIKVIRLWLNIAEVTRNGENLGFSVGITSADFSIDNFGISPQCGCGFASNSISNNQITTSSSVSSI